jgi:hypothetical protein
MKIKSGPQTLNLISSELHDSVVRIVRRIPALLRRNGLQGSKGAHVAGNASGLTLNLRVTP